MTNARVKSRAMRRAWVVAITGILLAYAAVVSREHRQLAAVRAAERSVYDAANRNERIISQEAALISERNYVRADIARMVRDTTRPADALLGELDVESAELGVRVISVNPSADIAEGAGARRTNLRSDAFTIEVDGTFESLLALLHEMTSGTPLIGVESIAMTTADAEQKGPPTLHATVSARAYELDAHWSQEFR
jgi:hypothetical protein